MALQEPESMDELVYFTRRNIGEGNAVAWVYRKICPKCKKERMGKPKDKKGKVMIRAKEFVCYACGYTEPEEIFEESLVCSIKYTCPKCRFEGEIEVPFKRKKIQIINEETGKKKAAESIRFQCGKCKADIDVTKKLK
ncbi:MAG: hypothetical protein Q7J54_06610 [Candidatus Woesearchaeota archaeon]|nr:hypothetical protein [Candidatus Woesearchaeota archaeon]